MPLQCFPVRHAMGLRASVRFLFASDLHLTHWSPQVGHQLLRVVQEWRPDFVVLGGDLVDWPCAVGCLRDLIRQLADCTPVLAITGNHDHWVGLSRVRKTVREAGAILLDHPWTHERSGLEIHGSLPTGPAPPHSLLAIHNPSDFPKAVEAGFPLALAGHLHGCQFILWERAGLQYPGAWFYRYNGREFSRQRTRMVVSLGVHDTLPIRWNCPREVLAVEITPEE